MDESLEILNHDHPASPSSFQQKPAGSGLTLVLPPLKGGRPIKGGKKGKRRSQLYDDIEIAQEKRIPRPIKLKPLKDVLAKLIAQIKKKDDYAFFLQPVDVSQVPGYTDIVKRPMDFGTMSNKVNRGKYRSLEEFAADFRLVTGNAKLFNPPETIYHTEAQRIENWGLEHISKAASTVIQYETDWNIEIENDEDGQTVNVDDDDDFAPPTPMDVDDPGPSVRSPSVSSQIPLATRRATRTPYKKPTTAPTTTISESIDAEGRMPGSREGLGAFPPGSDWARTMVALKLKGKRYKTKKERLRVEKDGPPMLPDGTLDYFEMEDPFSVLQALAPDPPSRPTLLPIYPPLQYTPAPTLAFAQPESEPSQSQPPPLLLPFPAATSASPLGAEQVLSSIPASLLTPFTSSPWSYSSATEANVPPRKPRHWTVVRNASSRGKGKEKEDDSEQPEIPTWQLPREAQATDYGSYSLLAAALAEEMNKRGVSGREGEEEEHVRNALKESLDYRIAANKNKDASGGLGDVLEKLDKDVEKEYWTSERAAEGEDYIRDIVYGGVEGLAYVRSLAEFVKGVMDAQSSPPSSPPLTPGESSTDLTLAQWVEQHIVDELTEGRHSMLRCIALRLNEMPPCQEDMDDLDKLISKQLVVSLQTYPAAMSALSTLLQLNERKIDMGALIKTPNELFVSEKVWIGKVFKERRRALRKSQKAASKSSPAPLNGVVSANGTVAVKEEEEEDEPEAEVSHVASTKTKTTKPSMNGTGNGLSDDDDDDIDLETPEELNHVLDYVTGLLIQMDQQIRSGSSACVGAQGKGDIHKSAANFGGRRGGGDISGGKGEAMTPDNGQANANQNSDTGVIVSGGQDDHQADGPMTPVVPGVAGSTGIKVQAQSQQSKPQPIQAQLNGGVSSYIGSTPDNEPDAVKNLRLNLLALAKRAPLDTIARLPKDLVPEHIRQYVPTLGSS